MIKGISSNNSTLLTSVSKEKKENIGNEKVQKSRIETIKESIKNGTYKIDINKTAESLAKSLL